VLLILIPTSANAVFTIPLAALRTTPAT